MMSWLDNGHASLADRLWVDDGLDVYNHAVAPLDEVEKLVCVAIENEERVAGAVGRTWGDACELQQLFVAEHKRAQGLGRAALLHFEALARARGCREIYLETFSFQAPGFYLKQGYEVAFELRSFPRGIVKFFMNKPL